MATGEKPAGNRGAQLERELKKIDRPAVAGWETVFGSIVENVKATVF